MKREDFRATVAVGFGLLLATLTGFLRQVTIARLLGASRTADIYLVAFAIPEFIFIALPIILSPAFLPIFSQIQTQEGNSLAWQFARRVLKVLGFSLIFFTIIAAVTAPFFLHLISPGFEAGEDRHAAQLFYPMLPGILFMGIATLVATILQVYRKFLHSIIITSAYNLAFITSLFLLPIKEPDARAAWSVSIGAASALVMVIPFWWKQSRLHSTSNQVITDPIKDWSRLTALLVLGYSLHHLILFIDRAMATTFPPGSVSALSYADHLTLVIGQLSGLAVSTVLFPGLAKRLVRGEMEFARQELSNALTLVLQIAIPASAGLILLREPIITLLFQRGAFNQQATSLVSGPMVWYSIAVVADSFCQPLWRIVYAGRSGWTVVIVNGLQTAIRLVGNLLFTLWFGYVGLAMSASIGLIAQSIFLSIWARKKYAFRLDRTNWGKIFQTSLATLFAVTTAGLIYFTTRTFSPILTVAVCLVSGAIVYILFLHLSRNFRRAIYGA